MNVQTLSVKEAAEIFKVKPKTIRAWIAQGKLAAHRIGRSYLIPAGEVERASTQPKEEEASGGMKEFIALLRSVRPADPDAVKAAMIAQDRKDRREDKKQSLLYPKRPDPDRRARVMAMKGTLIGTGLTLTSIDDLRREELAQLDKPTGSNE